MGLLAGKGKGLVSRAALCRSVWPTSFISDLNEDMVLQ